MSAADDAQWCLDQLREQNQAALDLGRPSLADGLVVDKMLHPDLSPRLREQFEREAQEIYDRYAEGLARTQRNIEQTAATTFMSVDLGQRPLVAHLWTGQTHAVCVLGMRRLEGRGALARTASALSATVRSLRLPLLRSGNVSRMPLRAWWSSVGDHWRNASWPRPYLILFEDQLPLFIEQICGTVARAMPSYPAAPGKMSFKLSVPDVTEWIAAHPEIGAFFANLIVGYAVDGRIRPDPTVYRTMAPDHRRFAGLLRESVRYFILSHEYAHIMMGHLDTTATRRGVLPAADAESLDYSHGQEAEADSMGTMLALNACVDHAKLDHAMAFLGVGLYLDVMDMMDRAVAFLGTGNENLRQIGSHPPAAQRKRSIRRMLSIMVDAGGGDLVAEKFRTALAMEEIQAEIIRLLWERTRPVLLDLRQRGVRPARKWLIVPTETADATDTTGTTKATDNPAPAPRPASHHNVAPRQDPQRQRPEQPKPSASPDFVPTSFLVAEVWDLPSRDGLMVSGTTLEGKIRSGMTLRGDAGQPVRVLSLEFLSPRDIALGQVTVMVERTNPSPVRRDALLTAVPPSE
ncbi:MAG TPA: hypothetical protein VHX38_31365 [Pseudonocardiaceae bacterium]|nr:hypothetical protein [Pseudonocardiaceae bacterium]